MEELAQHAEDRYLELRHAGLTEAEASRTTLHELGEHDLLTRELRSLESVPNLPSIKPSRPCSTS